MTPTEDVPRQRPAGRPTVRDPDFDPTGPMRPLPPLLVPQEHQRLVTNPFLAVLALLIAIYSGQQSADLWKLLTIVALIAPVCLLQYHCRDCGHTAWLFFWKEHACEAVVARQRAGQVRRLRGPKPTTQLILWIYLLGSIALLAAIVGRTV